jgi:hypothetical protein
LSKTSPTLRRLGVGVAALTTVAAGLTAAAPFVSAATGDITNLTLAPTSAANTTGGNVCQLYTLTATEPSSATAQGGQVTVVLNPNGNGLGVLQRRVNCAGSRGFRRPLRVPNHLRDDATFGCSRVDWGGDLRSECRAQRGRCCRLQSAKQRNER